MRIATNFMMFDASSLIYDALEFLGVNSKNP